MKFPLSLCVLLFAQSSFGVIYYVTPTGSAANSGLSLSSPKNQAWAQSGANSGDTVLFYPGNYTNLLLARSGVAIVAPYKWQAIVWGSNGLHGVSGNDGVANVMVDGLQIAYSYKDGAKANGSGWTMRNLWVHHAGRGDPLWVTNSTFAFSGQGIAWHGYGDILVERCLLEYNGADIGHDHGIYASGTNCIVRDNLARYNLAYAYQIFGSNPSSSANFWLINNIGYSNDTGFAQGKRCAVMYGDNGWGTNYAIGNTFSSPAASSGHALVFGGLAGCFLYATNNILSSAPSGIANDGAGTIVSDYNMYLASPTPSEGHATVASPIGFVSPSTGLYWLTVSSQARAHAFSAASPTNNFFGDPISSVSDIGAVDYTAILAADTRTLDPSPAGGADYWTQPPAVSSTFYVYCPWGGTQTGDPATPWKSLTASAWTTINAALASSDVTIHFSARRAASDVDMVYSATGSTTTPDQIDLTKRTDTSSHALTLNGSDFYNTSDSAPAWAAYSGNSKCKPAMIFEQNSAHTSYDYFNILGFHVLVPGSTKGIAISGSYQRVEGNVIEFSDGSGTGPALYLVPTADATHQGSSAYAPICHDIAFINNEIKNTSGEAIYVGGGGDNGSGGPPIVGTQGYPSHHDITITNNFIHDTIAFGAGQGDGIDVKGGIYNLTLKWNTISNLTDANASGIRGIVMQGQVGGTNGNVTVEGNLVYKVKGEDGSIVSENTWGTPNNVTLRNNVVYGSTHGAGIRLYANGGNMVVANNTIVSNTLQAIISDSGSTVVVTNNLLLNNNASGSQVDNSGTMAHDYNLFAGSSLGLTANPHEASTTLAANLSNAAGLDFSLKLGAPAVDTGTVVAGFAYDILGTVRPQGSAWDIGAYELRQSIARSASNLHVKNGYSGHP